VRARARGEGRMGGAQVVVAPLQAPPVLRVHRAQPPPVAEEPVSHRPAEDPVEKSQFSLSRRVHPPPPLSLSVPRRPLPSSGSAPSQGIQLPYAILVSLLLSISHRRPADVFQHFQSGNTSPTYVMLRLVRVIIPALLQSCLTNTPLVFVNETR
jgi:hypothetical protein